MTSIVDRRGAYRVLVGRTEERGHLEDLSVDGTIIIIQFIFNKWDRGKA
jgi:hypothetical protein